MIPAQAMTTTIRPVLDAVDRSDIYYLPIIHSTRFGRYFAYTSLRDASRKATIVKDIADGQIDSVDRVIAVDLTNGTCSDASKEIASLVVDALPSGESIPQCVVDFLEDHLGCAIVAAIDHELRHGRAA